MKKEKDEYRAKVTDDNGLTRGKVPSPLLRTMGARPGDDMIFRRAAAGKVTMHISRSSKRSSKGTKRR
jgi:hypothetical protein